MKRKNRGCAFLLVFALFVANLQGFFVNAQETGSMKITEEQMNVTQYDTYYYSEDNQYTYQGQNVTFVSESQIQAGGATYDLKNKKTDVKVTQDDAGNVSVSLSNLDNPVYQIPGEWNSSFGGKIQAVYKTDIPGMGEVRSDKLSAPIVLGNLEAGVYHLTDGKIYEKANSYSLGHDFGNGVVTEAYFGTLPNIEVTVTKEDADSSETPKEPEEGEVPKEPGDGETGEGSGDTGNTETGDIPESITGKYLGVKTSAKVYDDFTNDIWLQYQQRELNVGETASLRPWRVEQIVTDTINNDVARPNFHFDIIAGDSVTLDKAQSNERAIVTAVKPGTTIVKVTYDALDYKGQHWDGISAVNTGYVVYTVGETGTATIKTNDAFANWRHYDTIYYKNGSTVPFQFTVDTENAASVKVTCNGMEISGNGNKYTANLENRSNIIGIETTDADGKVKSMFRVIDARFIEVKVANKTNPEAALRPGDTATVSFHGITMPIYKLATIYNPCFESMWGGKSTRVQYSNDKLGKFEGKCGQWDLATRNSFDVEFKEAGEYTFTSANGIYCEWWGSPLGTDITANGSGEPNLNAPVCADNFSKLPEFTISVKGGDVEMPEDDFQIEPENIYPGTEVTVTLKNLKTPETATPVHAMETRYDTDIPGLDTIKSKDAKTDEKLLRTLTFTVPKDIEVGTYHLTNGRVYKKYGGFMVQGVFWTGIEEKEFYQGEMPDFTIVVKEKDEMVAQRVIDQINNLGEIVSILQDADVKKAREAYEQLTETQKKLVTNLDVLEVAEAKLQEIKDLFAPDKPEQEKPEVPEVPEKPEKPSTPDKKDPPKASGTTTTVTNQNKKSYSATQKVSNMVDANVEHGMVSAKQVEKVAGTNKNLRIKGKMEDGTEYTMFLNGKDVKKNTEFYAGITKQSAYQEEIRMLAPAPEIVAFAHTGKFPGEMLVEMKVEKPDGTYLLFRYNPETQKAEYVQKVEVKDEKARFLVSEGGDYFIDEKAKIKSVAELKETEDVQTTALEKSSIQNDDENVASQSTNKVVYVVLGIAALIGVFAAGYFIGGRKKGQK